VNVYFNLFVILIFNMDQSNHTEFQTTTGAQSSTGKDTFLTHLVVPLNQSELLMEIYSNGVPSPKAPARPIEVEKSVSAVKQNSSSFVE